MKHSRQRGRDAEGLERLLGAQRQRPHSHLPHILVPQRLGAGNGNPLEDCPSEPQFFFLLRTALNHQPPATTIRQPATANRQPLFTTVSLILCLAHVLTTKQRASP